MLWPAKGANVRSNFRFTRMSSHEYDLITIGAGSGGVAASRYAAAKGARVAICEADRVGGTCVIRGCVPKKIFMYAAQFCDAFTDAAGYGWQLTEPYFDLARLTAAKDGEIARIEAVYRRMLAESGVKFIAGRATVAKPPCATKPTTKLCGGRWSGWRTGSKCSSGRWPTRSSSRGSAGRARTGF
jgi:hypothetical protein